jgi:tetratricopeptide (TPR) repeat protein
LTGRNILIVILAGLLLGGIWGCASAPLPPPETASLAPPPVKVKDPDQVILKEALTGQRDLPPSEVAELSDRLLTDGNSSLDDQETMARLELLLLKTLKAPDKTCRPVLWRNLGIIHYYQKKYKQARQELQASNELNPKNARTHFYLARLFAHQGNIYAKKGKKRISRQQYKRAAIEMEQARKLEPSNSLYRQDIKQIIGQD